MAAPLPNRILREVVDIQCFGESETLAARSQVDQLCGELLTRALDELLGGWGVPDDQLISIDRLEVEVAGLASRDLDSRLVPRIIEALRIQLTNKVGVPGSFKAEAARPIRRSLLQQLLFFLERGCLPWSTRADTAWAGAVSELLARLDETELHQLRETLQQAPARLRLARHFPREVFHHILPQLWTDREARELLEDIVRIVASFEGRTDRAQVTERILDTLLECAVDAFAPTEIQAALELLIFELVAERSISVAVFEQVTSPRMREIVSSARRAVAAGTTRPAPGNRQSGKPPRARGRERAPNQIRGADEIASPRDAADREETIYIANGGLVIVAPYLPAFFRKLDLLEEERVRDLPTALSLLHYIVFGSDECAEWDFVLGKILCGVPIETAIETAPPLSDEQKAEANLLLEAVITNWTALKNTSPDALRTTFLQREGALSREQEHWRLRLTRTAYDVLVDHLPWTISMIQLSWMPWVLKMDWAD